ncbi:hypothetical protein Tco_0189508 [Tanacetum coccineum]
MGKDTIQLEDAVSTISQKYLLEFSSEYFIPKNLHPELLGPGDHIVDFPEGKIGILPNPPFVTIGDRCSEIFPTVVAWRTAATKDDKPKANTYSVVDVATLDMHPTASRVIQMVDAIELSTSSGIPSTVESAEQETPRRQQRDAGEGGSNAPAKVLRKYHDDARTEHSAREGKSLADMSVDTELAIHIQET